MNTWSYLAFGSYPQVAIFDEAHNLLGMLRDLASKKLWKKEYGYPGYLKSYRDLRKWVDDALEERPGDQKLTILKADLDSGANQYLVEAAEEPYFGKMAPCLKLLPIDTSKQPPLLWPNGKVKKIVLLSATIGPQDLHQLGLAKKRVCWIETESPIPAKNRPLIIETGFNVSAQATAADTLALVERIGQIAALHPNEKGVIHATYSQAKTLQGYLPEAIKKRILVHDKGDKSAQYARFLDSPAASGTILLAAGMHEGLDLVGDLARWQVIAKIPWPNLGEPAYKWLSESDPDRYGWEALKLVIQAYGRVCRTPTDRGITYCLDRSFERLNLDMSPTWFREAI